MTSSPRVAILGHVEWLTHAVGAFPRHGEIAFLEDPIDALGGGAAIAAMHAAADGAEVHFFTRLGGDDGAQRAEAALEHGGVIVHASRTCEAQPRAISTTSAAERSIAVLGTPMGPRGADDLPWDLLDTCGAAYVAAGDANALHRGRRTARLVSTSRHAEVIAPAGLVLDVLLRSRADPAESLCAADLMPPPRWEVVTEGTDGGSWGAADGTSGRWAAAPTPEPHAGSFGAGDAFAGGLAVALARGLGIQEACDAAAATACRALATRSGLPSDP